ncbi:DUF1153 domain-containing protein [Benzoatithermus flavus]|uniref:DUF1153 domain-containing protein n=1 Tax=Benzoatithermus flavus TaxID=3108223 RepID=A0ABU8XPY4_9PROT
MSERELSRPSPPRSRVIEPGDLPPPETRRWVARRKAQIVAAVRSGVLDQEDACRRYNISPEEFASWERAIDRHGLRALRVTKLQEFRQS